MLIKMFAYAEECVSIGVTWLGTLVGGGGSESTMGIRNFNLRGNQVRKRGKIGVNQSLIWIHPFSHGHPLFFIFPSSTQ